MKKKKPSAEHIKKVEEVWPGDRMCDAIDLKDGSILCMGRMAGEWGYMQYTISHDGGLTWTELTPVRQQGKPDDTPFDGCKPLLMRLKSGALGMTYGGVEGAFFHKSFDEGQTWTPAMGPPQYRTDPDDPRTGAGTAQARPVVLPSGRIIKPCSRPMAHTAIDPETGDRQPIVNVAKGYLMGKLVPLEGHTHEVSLDLAFVTYTDDEGETWHRNEDGMLFVCMDYGAGPIGSFDEPTTVMAPDGSVVMIGRTELGQLFKSVSTNDGVTWSQPEPAGLAAGCAPADVMRIPETDDVLLVWSQVSRDEIRRGLWRARLSSAISSDSCKTWKHFRCVEANGVPPYPRVPAEEPKWVRADQLLPYVPEDFAHSSYPRISMVGGFVVVACCQYRLVDRPQFKEAIGGAQLPERDGQKALTGRRVLPVEWFYDAD